MGVKTQVKKKTVCMAYMELIQRVKEDENSCEKKKEQIQNKNM